MSSGYGYRERRRLSTPADVMQQRADSLKKLQTFYVENLAEDKIDGTTFDCTILDVIQALKDKFCPLKRPKGMG